MSDEITWINVCQPVIPLASTTYGLMGIPYSCQDNVTKTASSFVVKENEKCSTELNPGAILSSPLSLAPAPVPTHLITYVLSDTKYSANVYLFIFKSISILYFQFFIFFNRPPKAVYNLNSKTTLTGLGQRQDVEGQKRSPRCFFSAHYCLGQCCSQQPTHSRSTSIMIERGRHGRPKDVSGDYCLRHCCSRGGTSSTDSQ